MPIDIERVVLMEYLIIRFNRKDFLSIFTSKGMGKVKGHYSACDVTIRTNIERVLKVRNDIKVNSLFWEAKHDDKPAKAFGRRHSSVQHPQSRLNHQTFHHLFNYCSRNNNRLRAITFLID